MLYLVSALTVSRVKRNPFRIPLTEPVYTGNDAKWRDKLRLRVLSNFGQRQTSMKNTCMRLREYATREEL